MGSSKRIIKQGIAITCCLLLVIGAGRAMAGEKEERNDERHVYVEEYDRTARADIKVRETIRADAGMGGQDVPGIEADDREEVPESEPEDTEAESASDGSGGDSTEAEAGDNDTEVDYAESADNTVSDMESTDSTGWDGGMENDSSVSEYSAVDGSGFTEDAEQYVYDSTGQYEYEDPGTMESGEGSTEEYDEPMSESEVSDTEYVAEPTGEMTYLGKFVSTAYCACPICTGSYSTGYTASGTVATEGRTVACNIYPFGTQLMIDGHIYTVEDTGWSPYGDAWIDLFFERHESALAYGCRTVDVYLVN